MFCSKCGKEIEDGVSFCPYCGNAVKTDQIVSFENDTVQNTNSLLYNIDYAKQKAKEAEELYQNAINTQRYAEQFSRKDISDLKELVKEKDTEGLIKKLKKAKIIMIFSIIIYLLVDLFGLYVLTMLTLVESMDLHILAFIGAIDIIALIGMVICIVLHSKQKKKVSALEETIVEDQRQIWVNSAVELFTKTENLVYDYLNSGGIIPAKYFNMYALNYIDEAVRSRRADSIKEAINLFEVYDQQQQIIRMHDQRYQELLEQQNQIMQNQATMHKQYNRDRAIDGIADAMIGIGILFS